jgi:hypothetical protein
LDEAAPLLLDGCVFAPGAHVLDYKGKADPSLALEHTQERAFESRSLVVTAYLC